MARPDHRDTLQGVVCATSAYLLWGVLPIFFKWMAHIPTWEIIAHRMLWSIPVVALVVWWQGRGTALRAILTNPRTLAMASLLAVILSINWGIYVWAVNAGRTLETALGYYINPLFSLLLATLLLSEHMDRLQRVAFALAATAVAVLTLETGGLPWVALALCVTWGIYAYFKRTLPIAPIEGFFLEMLVLAVPAAIALAWLGDRKFSDLVAAPHDTALLMASGAITAIPLLLYAVGAKGLRLSTIAIMQYMAPSIQFLIAIFLFKEPFSTTKLAAFALIWLALILYTIALVRR